MHFENDYSAPLHLHFFRCLETSQGSSSKALFKTQELNHSKKKNLGIEKSAIMDSHGNQNHRKTVKLTFGFNLISRGKTHKSETNRYNLMFGFLQNSFHCFVPNDTTAIFPIMIISSKIPMCFLCSKWRLSAL